MSRLNLLTLYQGQESKRSSLYSSQTPPGISSNIKNLTVFMIFIFITCLKKYSVGTRAKNKGIIKITKYRKEARKKSATVQIQKTFNVLQQNGLIPADLKTQDSKTVIVFCNELYKNYLKDNNTINNLFYG